MSIRRKSRFHAEMRAESMNDIMFFLMLFFLIISTVVNPSVIKLMLPKASTSQALNKQPLTLSITKERKYFINNTEVSLESLETKLKQELNGIPDPTIVLRADNSLSIQDLVNVLELGVKLKAKMVLSTDKK